MIGVKPNLEYNFKESFSQISASSGFQREIRKLWSMVLGRLGNNGRNSLLICSASMGEGSTTVTMGLGHLVARYTGKNVLLVDADFQGSLLRDLLEETELVPLIEEPEDKYSFAFEEFGTGISNLRYLKFKNPDFLETQLGNCEELSLFVNIIKKRYDYIFVDAPPILVSNVAVSLAGCLDAVLFVIAAGAMRYPLLIEALSRLDEVRDRILGAVLNKREYPLPKYLYRLIR
jgi:protein-tyrosine kinase